MADPQVQANDEQEIAEAQNSLVDLLYDVVAQGVTTRLGSFAYRRIDSVLSTVEKTAKWSLPQPTPTADGDADGDGNGGSKISPPPLIRPLPWILFLPALVIMRMTRVGLSLAALMVGKPPVTPAVVVYYVQNKRRKLRALKYRGQKLSRISRAEARAEDELKTTWLSRIIMPLRTIVRRPGRVEVTPHRHHHGRHGGQRGQNQQQQAQQQQQPGRKRNAHERDVGDDDEDSVDEATISELLDKYADDAGDSSYHADSASGETSDSSLSEKSAVEETPSKSTGQAKKESNGHAQKEGSQARRKSDLNVESNQKPTASKPTENGSVDGDKKQDATKEPAAADPEKSAVKEEQSKPTENGPADGSKTEDAAKEDRPMQEPNKPKPTPSASESDSKQTNVASQKSQPEEDGSKNQSMSEVKTNFQQKQNKQQQQPQHANANGGSGGKKQKRPSQGQ